MRTKDRLARLKQLQAEVNRIRRKLRISAPKEVLYFASLDEWGDREVVVEADGFGGAMTSIIKGNYPMEYDIRRAKKFSTEKAACDAAAELAEGDAEPEDVLA